jgi:hypothetical protein
MDQKIVLMIVVAIVLGMLVANMFKDICGCKVVEGSSGESCSGVALGTPGYCQWKWRDSKGDVSCPDECKITSSVGSDGDENTCISVFNNWTERDAAGTLDGFCEVYWNEGGDTSCCSFQSSQEEEPLASEDPLEEEEEKLEVLPQEPEQTITFNDQGCLVLSGGGTAPVPASVPVTVPASGTANCGSISMPHNCAAARRASVGSCLACMAKIPLTSDQSKCIDNYCQSTT